ncbi:MAG: SCP2 sterol-binding domain-containing protein [Chloroflexi bacterium]|nr:SCP2 sterol-binding domain-containing protein [Chloroflexota bacterium]
MSSLNDLNLEQTLEGMPLVFNPKAATDLKATIQFDISGDEAGAYYLKIANGACSFHIGTADSPTLTITTPSDVWLKISRGELSGQDALLEGLYTASGDLSLMLKMDALFQKISDASYEVTNQRPAGPINLSGMAWMTVAFIPWILHWSTFEIPSLSHWVSVGLPLLISLFIVIYRLKFDRPTFMEWGGLGYFTLVGTLSLMAFEYYSHWGITFSNIAMAGLWLSSVLFSQTPLSAEYSKWSFVKALWHNSLFIYPNAIISLVWGWLYVVAIILSFAAIFLPEQRAIFTIVRYLLLIPAFAFTATYQKRAPIANPRFNNSQLRFSAGVGFSALSGLLLFITMPGLN